MILGLVFAAIFASWLFAAEIIYQVFFENWVPSSLGEFVHEIFYTASGWALIVVGCGIGIVFAVLVLMISVVSLPMLLDRDVGAVAAVQISIQAVFANRKTMAIWGLIVSGALLFGSLLLFAGLAIVLPVLGHSTWHLYRKVIKVESVRIC